MEKRRKYFISGRWKKGYRLIGSGSIQIKAALPMVQAQQEPAPEPRAREQCFHLNELLYTTHPSLSTDLCACKNHCPLPNIHHTVTVQSCFLLVRVGQELKSQWLNTTR